VASVGSRVISKDKLTRVEGRIRVGVPQIMLETWEIMDLAGGWEKTKLGRHEVNRTLDGNDMASPVRRDRQGHVESGA
jgi:hypothetical protein